uniref:Small conductance calcium-activated potassium channel protein n=1 Tax=Anopheles stephensi TaxID=30069 RepID=A0A182YF90_ANOST
MSLQNDTDPATNSGYGSSDETASLLVMASTNSSSSATTTSGSSIISTINKPKLASHSSFNGPTMATGAIAGPSSAIVNPRALSATGNKPILIRQDRTSTYLASPQLSATGLGGSEESATGEDDQHNARSVPDIELHCRLEAPAIAVSASCHSDGGSGGRIAASDRAASTGSGTGGYQLIPYNRCRACRNCDRRASTTPMSSLKLTRSVSKESVRSALHSRLTVQHSTIPPVLITSSPTSGSRIIRQSSQPEASTLSCCANQCAHACSMPSSSLRQLREPGDGIAGIAADSMRINGGMRQFKQTLSQSRRSRLRRAFTEATNEMTYARTV